MVMVSAAVLAMTGLVAPSFATDNLTSAPTSAQISSIKSFSKNAVAQRKAAFKAAADLKPATAALTKAQANVAQAQVPLNAALDVKQTKTEALKVATAKLVAAQTALNALLPPKPKPSASASVSASASPTQTPAGSPSATPSNSTSTSPSSSPSTSPSATPSPSPSVTHLPIELVTPTNSSQPAKIKVIQQSLGIKQTGRWDSQTKNAFIKLQKSLGYKGSKLNGKPDKKSLSALVKRVKAIRAKQAAAAKARAIAQATTAVQTATEAVAARQLELNDASKRVTQLQAVVTELMSVATAATAKVNRLNAARTAAQASYKTNLARLNAITSIHPYSSDICVPGQEIGPETSWDCGVVTSIADGDTISVKTDTGTLVVRTLGVQAPEVDHLPAMPAQCGGLEASAYMKRITPVGTVVQLRSRAYASYNTRTSEHRYYREIYIKDANGNFTVDTADELYKRGLAIWFPLAVVPGSGHYESVPNKRYFQELTTAISQKKGMWSTTLCPDAQIDGYDAQRDITPKIWALMDPPGTDNVAGPSDSRAEYIVVKNPLTSSRPLDLSYWKIRDTALNFFMFPKGTIVKPGHIVKVYVGKGTNVPSRGLYFFNLTRPLFQNFDATLYRSTGYLLGDGVYLTDRQGSNHSGGNMRAWFHNPCIDSAGAYTASCGTLVTEKVAVPNVLTQVQSAAVAALKAAHLGVKIVKAVDANHVGQVTAISVPAGTRVDVDTVITLTVGIAPAPAPTPSSSTSVTPTASSLPTPTSTP